MAEYGLGVVAEYGLGVVAEYGLGVVAEYGLSVVYPARAKMMSSRLSCMTKFSFMSSSLPRSPEMVRTHVAGSAAATVTPHRDAATSSAAGVLCGCASHRK